MQPMARTYFTDLRWISTETMAERWFGIESKKCFKMHSGTNMTAICNSDNESLDSKWTHWSKFSWYHMAATIRIRLLWSYLHFDFLAIKWQWFSPAFFWGIFPPLPSLVSNPEICCYAEFLTRIFLRWSATLLKIESQNCCVFPSKCWNSHIVLFCFAPSHWQKWSQR